MGIVVAHVLDVSTLTPVSIPTIPGRPYYTQRTKLDDKEYALRFAYNEKRNRVSLDILASNSDPIAVGIQLVSNWPLLRFYKYDDRCPPGEMLVVDTTADGSPPGLYDLGIGLRCTLVYHAISSGLSGAAT